MQRDARALNCESVGCDSEGKSRGRKGLQVDICADFNDFLYICIPSYLFKTEWTKIDNISFSLELYSLQTRNTKDLPHC